MCGSVESALLRRAPATAEEGRLACRFVLEATHTGAFMGIAATGKAIRVAGMTILRFANGCCVERWNQSDMLGWLQQLGAVPAP